MTAAPSLSIWIHLTAAPAATALALTVLLRRKGTVAQVLPGRIWVGLMVTVVLVAGAFALAPGRLLHALVFA